MASSQQLDQQSRPRRQGRPRGRGAPSRRGLQRSRELRKHDLLLAARGQRHIARCTPHTLRRTFASILAEINLPPRRAMYLLGHADPTLTMRVYEQVIDMGDLDLLHGKQTQSHPAGRTSPCKLLQTTGSARAGSVPDFAAFRRGSVHQLSTENRGPIEHRQRLARCGFAWIGTCGRRLLIWWPAVPRPRGSSASSGGPPRTRRPAADTETARSDAICRRKRGRGRPWSGRSSGRSGADAAHRRHPRSRYLRSRVARAAEGPAAG